MKKLLLLTFVLGIVSIGLSQKQYKIRKNTNKSKDINIDGVKKQSVTPILNTKAVNEDINRIFIGKGADFRTVRKDDNRTISYNPELDIITVTFILDPATYSTNATDIGMCYSTDKGQTWSAPLVIVDNGNEYINDFPSGIIFNPEGNTNINNAYGIIQNISHQGGDWGFKMWANMTLGGENHVIDVSHNPDNMEDGYWNQQGLTQINNQVRCLSMLPTGEWNNYQTAELQPIYGDYEGDYFTWDESQLIDMDLYQDTEDDGTMAWTGNYTGHDNGIEMTWSQDGEIGYIWMIGVNNDEATGYRPLVYRTDNAGDSWEFVNIDFLDDDIQTFFEPYISETPGGLMIPSLLESCGTVDYHGDLQMFFIAGSHSADVTINPDSLGWSYSYPGDIFNIVVDEDGIQNIIWVDSLNAQNLHSDTEGNFGNEGWNHRISVARNSFANEIFLTWADTENPSESESDFNINPDIYGWSKNIHTGDVSELINFTSGSLYEKYYFFTYGAENAYYNESENTYTIPYLQAVNPTEFGVDDATAPISLSFITGIEFSALGEYVAINDSPITNSITVTQNIPNPFNGSTRITVTTETSADVMIEVSNIMGQTIYTSYEGRINGSKEITLNANNLEAGVYFYTVTVGNNKTTKKMIVK